MERKIATNGQQTQERPPVINHTGRETVRTRDKVRSWLTQQQKVFSSLYRKPQTRLQVSRSTGVPLQNICRYISTFRKSQTVFVVKVDRCPISEMKAEFLSTDPKHAPHGQVKLWD